MLELLGIAMYIAQVRGIVIVFQSTTNPVRLKYVVAIGQILFFIAMLGLTLE